MTNKEAKYMNTYKCSRCGELVLRDSQKKWIKSFCDEKNVYSRLIFVSKFTPLKLTPVTKKERREDRIKVYNK